MQSINLLLCCILVLATTTKARQGNALWVQSDSTQRVSLSNLGFLRIRGGAGEFELLRLQKPHFHGLVSSLRCESAASGKGKKSAKAKSIADDESVGATVAGSSKPQDEPIDKVSKIFLYCYC